MIKKIKQWLINNVNSKYLELLTGKGISITKTPIKGSAVSDLFPLRIEDGWNTFFELLNYYQILNPEDQNKTSGTVEIKFYDRNGIFLKTHKIKNSTRLKHSLNLKEIANQLGINHDGVFAVFHQNHTPWISEQNSFLAERGYIGFENGTLGNIKSFIHGNLDAISQSKKGEERLLGNTSFLNKEYHLQHDLLYKFTYELFWVNPSNKFQHLKIVERRHTKDKLTVFKIPPKGIKSLLIVKNKNKENTKIIIKSKLYMARPVVFKYMENSFDVFHG
tara:strand:+ start:839 stop:1666 length:828 start_codon:yes stop_codon:yes gene_type:complete